MTQNAQDSAHHFRASAVSVLQICIWEAPGKFPVIVKDGSIASFNSLSSKWAFGSSVDICCWLLWSLV